MAAPMMQWSPKGAARVNITGRYGKGAVGLAVPGKRQAPPFIADKLEPTEPLWHASANAGARDTLKRLWGAKVPFIDLRDEAEAAVRPVARAARFHHHDLLSGACDPVLPRDRTARLVVFSTGRQRAINAFNALRQRGYDNVTVADADAVIAAVAEGK
mmetsp:Transcript_53588/g.164809  ORF Transcript_53588/g.164809 Transcript_53588/m.164809 type:complete len:158 (-) Transcript_53588:19-492(-)|eukprot:CAMPEP_0174855384 /NCGR_PEP_ID=MMETSP1114-20130205/33146_1 /TAXON_ID=312471 /ORGANISM="Neobodo designis, Strain CCAP 1951/1" /LENGTH=157 /DNA_ID=CAMNT_0016090123 /DNA_START=84 /DNA_END=557 /DNA_ORIENTATION=-